MDSRTHSQSPALSLAVFSLLMKGASGWGSGSDSSAYAGIYGNNLERDWLYDAKGISIQVEGCLWAYWQDKEDEDSGCLEESSEDGTTYWYQMSNCRRAQVVWSVYASDSSANPGCNSGNFKESFVTTSGVQEFIYYLSVYDQNSPFGNDGGYDELPMCDGGDDGYPIGLSCTSDGLFSLEYFSDQYCLTRSGTTYDYLNNFNSAMKTYRNCQNIGGGNGNDDGGGASYLIQYLIANSYSCSSADSGICQDSEAAQERANFHGSSSGSRFGRSHSLVGGGNSVLTKLKYAMGGLLLLASFVMFTGILFTNRRRRRALLQRKYRQAKRSGRSVSGRSRQGSRSASKSRGDSSRKSRRSSKSRERNASSAAAAHKDEDGVFT